MEDLLAVIIYIGTTAVVGCLWGLIPFFLGRHRYRPNMGRLGLIWCGVAGPFLLAFFVMLGFVIAILVSERDARSAQRSSRHHCALRWQQGVPVLVDLGSAYGTYMGDGRRLPPNYPMNVGPGTRFYLSSPGNLFQITVI